MSEPTENIKVFVRVRPSTAADIHKMVHVISDQELKVSPNVHTDNKYKFNAIFPEHIHPDEAYNVIVVPIVRDVIQGYNATLFSYGATREATNVHNASSTVTTPIAPPSNNVSKFPAPQIATDSMNALVSCAMYRLFEHITQLELSSSVRISYLQISDEELFDLLQPNNGTQLKIFENHKNQVYVNGLSETTVHSANEAIMMYRMAQKNVHSQKSHTIFTVSLQSKEKPKIQMEEHEVLFKYRKFCLVQLGGHPECQKNQARAKTVQSLTSLSRVVQALITKQSYIPYRDSKLTRIMQESLGGNAKTSIVAHIGVGSQYIDETMQAVELLNRMKAIFNYPKINERLDDARSLNEMTLEIRKLIMDIEANVNKTGHFLTDEMYTSYQNEMHTTKADTRKNKQELMLVHEEGNDLDSTVSNVNSHLCDKRNELAKLQSTAFTKQRHLQIISNVTQQRNDKINRHTDVEKAIIGQAAEITDTVRKVLVDKTNLDDCVTRYKLADEQLIKTVAVFQADMQHKLEYLRKHSSDTRTDVDEKLRRTADLEKNFLHGANSLVDMIKNKSFALLEQLEKNLNQESDTYNDVKGDFNNALTAHIKDSEANTTQYVEYAKHLEQHSNTIETSYQELRALYLSHFEAVNKIVDDMINRMKTHESQASKLLNAMRLTVGESAVIGCSIDDKMQAIYEQMREIVLEIEQNAANIKRSVESALEASAENVQKTKASMLQSLDAHQISMDEQKMHFEQPSLADDFKANQLELKDILVEKTQTANDLLQRVAVSNNSAMDISQKHVCNQTENFISKRNIIEHKDEVQQMREDLDTNEMQHTRQYTEHSGLLNNIALTTKQMVKTFGDEITATCNQLKYFNNMDFCVYESSGDTPSKREYNTNVSLVATTPLEKIKQRFRERLSQINNSHEEEYSFLSN